MGGQEAEIWGQSFLTPLTPWGKTLIYCDVICYSQVPNERGGPNNVGGVSGQPEKIIRGGLNSRYPPPKFSKTLGGGVLIRSSPPPKKW